MEPPGPHVHRGPARAGLIDDLRIGAGIGAVVLAVAGAGDVFLLAALLGVAAWDPRAGITAGAAAAATLARWGSSSMAAVAGAQAALGPALVVGPPSGAASSVLAALALVLVAPVGLVGYLYGAAAGVLAVGPSAATPLDVVIRAAGLAAGVALTRAPRPGAARLIAPAVAVAAVAAAVPA